MKCSLISYSIAHFICVVLVVKTYGCGGYISTKDGTTSGTITSPNYPSNYTDRSHCIWLIEAPIDKRIKMDIGPVQMAEDCTDFLEVTNGNSAEKRLYYACMNDSSVTVRSTDRWLWVRFYSNNNGFNIGFSADWQEEDDEGGTSADVKSPIVDCQSVHFKCPNKECISWAYHCDGQEDCGCTESGCDEQQCTGLGLSEGAIIGIGVSVGIVVFTSIFLGIGFLEIYLKRRSENEYKRKVDAARRRARQKKNKDAGDITKDALSRKESHSQERSPVPSRAASAKPVKA